MAELSTTARVIWLLVGVAGNAAAGIGGALWMTNSMLSGFETSQNTLSQSISDLTGALNSQREITNEQMAEARGNLTEEIGKLTTAVGDLNKSFKTTGEQIAGLNGTLEGLDKRLSDSIKRQADFEAIVLKRIVFQGPLPEKPDPKSEMAWKDTGVDIGPIFVKNEGKSLMDWASYLNPPK